MSGDSAAELFVDVSARETVSAVLSRLESQLDKTNTSVEKFSMDGYYAGLFPIAN